MSITTKQEAYRPFHYPHFFDYYKTALASVWRPETVNMAGDVHDYQYVSTDAERHVIRTILKTFTIMETHIGDYWSDRVCKMFPRHEIVAAARAFAFFEVIHAQAYDWLNASLGIEDFDSFLSDPASIKKIGHFINHPHDAVSLAVFSGAGEGVSLFSSFAALLSLSLDGRYKGLQQIISWSVSDEMLHSKMGCDLFRIYVEENGLSDEDRASIIESFNTVIENEFVCIDQIFALGDLKRVKKESLKDYIKYRAIDRLNMLQLNSDHINVDGSYKEIKSWFEPLVIGQSSNDFFAVAVDGKNYSSVLSQDYSQYDYTQTKIKCWNI